MKFLKSIERIEADNNPIKLFENCLKQITNLPQKLKMQTIKNTINMI